MPPQIFDSRLSSSLEEVPGAPVGQRHFRGPPLQGWQRVRTRSLTANLTVVLVLSTVLFLITRCFLTRLLLSSARRLAEGPAPLATDDCGTVEEFDTNLVIDKEGSTEFQPLQSLAGGRQEKSSDARLAAELLSSKLQDGGPLGFSIEECKRQLDRMKLSPLGLSYLSERELTTLKDAQNTLKERIDEFTTIVQQLNQSEGKREEIKQEERAKLEEIAQKNLQNQITESEVRMAYDEKRARLAVATLRNQEKLLHLRETVVKLRPGSIQNRYTLIFMAQRHAARKFLPRPVAAALGAAEHVRRVLGPLQPRAVPTDEEAKAIKEMVAKAIKESLRAAENMNGVLARLSEKEEDEFLPGGWLADAGKKATKARHISKESSALARDLRSMDMGTSYIDMAKSVEAANLKLQRVLDKVASRLEAEKEKEKPLDATAASESEEEEEDEEAEESVDVAKQVEQLREQLTIQLEDLLTAKRLEFED